MEEVKKTGDYKIFKKKSGRFGVRSKDGKWINGMDKAEILNKEGFIKWDKPKAPPVEAAAETPPPAEEATANPAEKKAE